VQSGMSGSAEAMLAQALPAVGTLYGYGLTAETPVDGPRSDQAVRATVRDASGGVLGYVDLSEGPAYGSEIVSRVALSWAVAGIVAVILAAVAGWWISRRITEPLTDLAGVTARMAAGDLAARADTARRDELGALARSYNEMAERVEGMVGALRRFVADAAHELHTPLTALRTNLELAEGAEDPAARHDYLTQTQAQVARLERLSGGLLDLSRLESGAAHADHAPLDLAALVREQCERYASQAEQAGLAFVLETPATPLMVSGNTTQLLRTLDNLVDNAVKFTPEGGRMSIILRAAGGGQAELCVADSGIGIPAEDLPDLFTRFHRGRNAGSYAGNGLGLAIVRAIVEAHGGTVSAERLDRGTRLKLRLGTLRASR